MRSIKYIGLGMVAIGLAVVAVLLFSSQPVYAHCTGYHPHHCDLSDLDPTNSQGGVRRTLRDAEEQLRDVAHLGGQGCREQSSIVQSDNEDILPRALTELERKYLGPWFDSHIDLDKVEVYWGAKLNDGMSVGDWEIWVPSAAQTFGYRVYFAEDHRNGNTEQLISLAHELVHVVQYERAGRDMLTYCQRYMDGWTDAGGDYHNNNMESEAFDVDWRFAQSLRELASGDGTDILYQHGMPNNMRTTTIGQCLPNVAKCSSAYREIYVKNNCHKSFDIIMRYQTLSGDWLSQGWWNFEPGEGAYLSSSGHRIGTSNSYLYYYATVPNETYSWSGSEQREFAGTTYPMKEWQATPDGDGDWYLQLSCSNL